MTDLTGQSRTSYLSDIVNAPPPAGVVELVDDLQSKYPGSAILLYGSGASVLKDADPADVLFDFYIIAPTYEAAFRSRLMRFLNRMIPPNVFYVELKTPNGIRRAKYAVLSLAHFERLVSRNCFHSYFWARFAQPSRIVAGSSTMRKSVINCIETAIDTFTVNIAALSSEEASVRDLWRAGLGRSYKAELRAETPNRVDALLDSYGTWPDDITRNDLVVATQQRARARRTDLAWRIRIVQGGFLSVGRLLKGAFTFQGGLDYITWKIARHTGVDVPIRNWERAIPLIGIPFVVERYYRLRRVKTRHGSDNLSQ